MRVYVSSAIQGHEKETDVWRKDWKKVLEKAGFTMFDPWLDRPRNTGIIGTVRDDIRKILSTDVLLVMGDTPSWGQHKRWSTQEYSIQRFIQFLQVTKIRYHSGSIIILMTYLVPSLNL